MGKFIVNVFTMATDKAKELLEDFTDSFATKNEAVAYAEQLLTELQEDGIGDYSVTVKDDGDNIVYDSAKDFAPQEVEEEDDLELDEEDMVFAADEKAETPKKKYAKEISTINGLKKEKNITDKTNAALNSAIDLVIGWLNEFVVEAEKPVEKKPEPTTEVKKPVEKKEPTPSKEPVTE